MRIFAAACSYTFEHPQHSKKLNMAKDGWLKDTAMFQPKIFSHQKSKEVMRGNICRASSCFVISI
jgi:hypothetical protein